MVINNSDIDLFFDADNHIIDTITNLLKTTHHLIILFYFLISKVVTLYLNSVFDTINKYFKYK